MTSTTSNTEEKVAAFDALRALDPHVFMDNATYFSCTEADAIAVFITAAHGQDLAEEFLGRHAYMDDEGDLHNPDGSSRRPTAEDAATVIDKEIG